MIYPVSQKNNLNGTPVCISAVKVCGEYSETAEKILSEYNIDIEDGFSVEITVSDSRRTTYVEDLSMLSDE